MIVVHCTHCSCAALHCTIVLHIYLSVWWLHWIVTGQFASTFNYYHSLGIEMAVSRGLGHSKLTNFPHHNYSPRITTLRKGTAVSPKLRLYPDPPPPPPPPAKRKKKKKKIRPKKKGGSESTGGMHDDYDGPMQRGIIQMVAVTCPPWLQPIICIYVRLGPHQWTSSDWVPRGADFVMHPVGSLGRSARLFLSVQYVFSLKSK